MMRKVVITTASVLYSLKLNAQGKRMKEVFQLIKLLSYLNFQLKSLLDLSKAYRIVNKVTSLPLRLRICISRLVNVTLKPRAQTPTDAHVTTA